MGGGTSSSLPDKLDSDLCQQLCGEQYRAEIFDSLKGEDGLVDKSVFIRYVQLRNSSSLSSNSSHVRERAFKDIFKAYSHPNKGLTLVHYLQLLRDLRWMNAKFPSAQATVLFDENKDPIQLLTYDLFRGKVLAAIAAAKEWDMPKLLNRLAKHDSAIMAAYVAKKFSDKTPMQGISEAAVTEEEPAFPVELVSDIRVEAAIKLQSILRQRSSSILLKDMKNVKSITPDNDIFIVIDKAEKDEGWEVQLCDLYKATCKPHGSMMFGHFKTMISCLGLRDLKFTNRDAEIAFQTIIALASHPNAGTYSRGVTFGKAINYVIFREIGLPVIADKKGVELDDLKMFISRNVTDLDMRIFSVSSQDDSFDTAYRDDWTTDIGITVG